VTDLRPLLAPSSVALIAETVGEVPGAVEVEDALCAGGYEGVFQRVDVEDARALDDLVPATELAVVSVGRERIAVTLDTCVRKGCRAAIVLNGPEGDLDAAEVASEQVTEFARSSLVVLGPNSQGVLSLPNRLFAGTGSLLRHHDLRRGGVAVVTQSGFGHALVALGDAEGVGFNYVVATGNEAGIDAVDVARWLVDRDEVQLIWLILEGVSRGRELAEVGWDAFERGKPLVAWKTGSTEAGRVAAASHTGAIASDDGLFRAAAHAGRFVLVHGEDELIDATRALTASGRTTRRGVGIVTVSGGAGVALADCCADAGLTIPPLSAATVEEIRRRLPLTRPVGNPLDVTRSVVRNPDTYRTLVELVGNDESVGHVILCHGGIDGDRATALAHAASAARSSIAKPLTVVWAPRRGSADEALGVLAEAGVPSFSSVRRAASASAALCSPEPSARPSERERFSSGIAPPLMNRPLAERDARQYLEAYGIPVVAQVYLQVEDGQPLPPESWNLRFPVVAKVDTTEVRSRKAAGLVRLGLSSPDVVLTAVGDMLSSARDAGHIVEGITVQEMVDGLEVFVGGLVDLQFGPAVTVGLGGPFVEALSRPTVRLAPLSRRGALQAVLESEITGALTEAQRDGVADCLSRLSWLLVEQASWLEQIDVNPLFVSGSGVFAADAFIVPSSTESPDSDRTRWPALEPLE
jgi:acyl-CoA synthetase (NDP forming)